MIKIENCCCRIEGKLETVLQDYCILTKSVQDVLIKTYGFDKKDAKDLMKKCFKKVNPNMELEIYEEKKADE